jgi:hypothetical protein
MNKELYQQIYEKEKWYGNAKLGRCPGMRLLPVYESYLKSPVVELGCGRGSVVEELLKRGYECEGYDQIELNPNMKVGDITKDMNISGKTVLCIDVIEHIDDVGVSGLFQNFKKFERQIFAIHNGPSLHNGVELHINRKLFSEWEEIIIKNGFKIIQTKEITTEQRLYLTTNKP